MAGKLAASSRISYPDGVTVTVTSIKKGTESGRGPGVVDGRPYVGFSVQIDNRSKVNVDLTQVVVTTTYGSPARVAAPVYEDAAAQDFSGTVKPGQKASAVYFFAVPAQDRADVTTAVDFDGIHEAAIFRGCCQLTQPSVVNK